MTAKMACMAGGPLCRAMASGTLAARELPSAKTPFGASERIFIVEQALAPFYLVPRVLPAEGNCKLPGAGRRAPSHANHRATLYALKDLGVQAVVSWSAAGAISHNYGIGQVIVPDDVIDMTCKRATTFFEQTGLGLLRQFPVFCPHLRGLLEGVLGGLGLQFHSGGTAAVTEGPRLETPAEVRMLASGGAELVTHTLVPEVFLAKELQMCFAGACYLVNFAETGSRHRPFSGGDLFGGLSQASAHDPLRRVKDSLPQLLVQLAQRYAAAPCTCECPNSMAYHISNEGMDPDWHQWF